MHAAAISLMLMAGTCAEPCHGCTSPAADAGVPVWHHGQPWTGPHQPAAGPPYGPLIGPTCPGPHRWLAAPWTMCCRMMYYPGNYTRPYPYRKTFDYPWSDPRQPIYVDDGPFDPH
jgi:hypothetical protein